MLEEIALNCPLRENEAAGIKKDYETASTALDENRPPLFVQGLIPLISALSKPAFFLFPRPSFYRFTRMLKSSGRSQDLVFSTIARSRAEGFH